MSLGAEWKQRFFDIVQRQRYALPLQEASLTSRHKRWTEILTAVAVQVCEAAAWQAAAKGHRLEFLPKPGSEYLGIDVMAFEDSGERWSFPIAAIELENSRKDDRVGYSLWKVLCIRTQLRMVFCYRTSKDAGSALVTYLNEHVVNSLGIENRTNMTGETIVVMGYRNKAETFPYGFFRWWKLDTNVGRFELFR